MGNQAGDPKTVFRTSSRNELSMAKSLLDAHGIDYEAYGTGTSGRPFPLRYGVSLREFREFLLSVESRLAENAISIVTPVVESVIARVQMLLHEDEEDPTDSGNRGCRGLSGGLLLTIGTAGFLRLASDDCCDQYSDIHAHFHREEPREPGSRCVDVTTLSPWCHLVGLPVRALDTKRFDGMDFIEIRTESAEILFVAADVEPPHAILEPDNSVGAIWDPRLIKWASRQLRATPKEPGTLIRLTPTKLGVVLAPDPDWGVPDGKVAVWSGDIQEGQPLLWIMGGGEGSPAPPPVLEEPY